MFVFTFVVHALFVVVSSQDGNSCVTPNNETATCIPINSCPVIKKALQYLSPDAVEFARKSQCGYDHEGPLVCCGSSGRVTTPKPPVQKTTPKQNVILDLPPAAPIDNHMLPDLTLCGIQEQVTRTKNGNVVEKEEHPWLAVLRYVKDSDNSLEYKCNGVLLNQKYVLTNAECVKLDGYTLKSARLGAWNLAAKDEYITNGEEKLDPVEEVNIVEQIIHPYFNPRKGSNNIALLRLERKVHYTAYIRAICLPPNDFPPPIIGTVMEASGWTLTSDGSKSDVKLKAEITQLRFDDCDKAIANYTNSYYPGRICAKSTNDSPLCTEESGVPLITKYEQRISTAENLEEQWYLEGLVPRGFGCDGSGKPGLYMRISRYVTWIINNIH